MVLSHILPFILVDSNKRNGVAHIGIVITDGYSNNRYKTSISATTAKDKNINLFAIGMSWSILGECCLRVQLVYSVE